MATLPKANQYGGVSYTGGQAPSSKYGEIPNNASGYGGSDYAFPQANNAAATNPAIKTDAAKTYIANQGGAGSSSTGYGAGTATANSTRSVTLPSGLTGTTDAAGNFTPTGGAPAGGTGMGTGYGTGSASSSSSSSAGNPYGTPSTPNMSPYRAAFDEYLSSLKPSAEETSARELLGNLTLQSKKDYEEALGKGETLGFASGEAARVNRNNSFGIEAAGNALGAFTANRQAMNEGTKARLDFEKGLYDDEREDSRYAGEQAFDQKKFDEDTRRYGLDYAQKQQQIGQNDTQQKFENDMATKKFEEDKRQYGLDYAIKQKELAISQQKANQDGVAAGGGAVSPENSLANIEWLMTTAQDAIDKSGSSGASGINKFLGDKFVGDSNFRQLESLTNTLRTNVLTLMTDPNVKKFFGPQMSEADVKLMTAGGTTLNPENQSPAQLKTEAERLLKLFTRMKTSMSGATGSTGGSTSGGTSGVTPSGIKYTVTP